MSTAIGNPISPERAQALVRERARPLPSEQVALAEALGRTLAVEVASTGEVPGFDNSAMDGYAVRAADTARACPERPVRLALAGESRAGRPASAALEPGQAMRISTGAMLPSGADAVVRVEEARELGAEAGAGAWIETAVEIAPGRDIRRAGEKARAGEPVLARGTLLGPAELGVCALVGLPRVACARRPRVAVIATGDELVEPGEPVPFGGVRNVNAHSVPAQARAAGAEPVSVRAVPDDRGAIVAAIRQGLGAADLLLVCGGVSVGAHDHVKAAFAQAGVEEVFWRVAMRPGRPTWFGVHGSTLVFGLPGNPISAMTAFDRLVAPAIETMLGARPGEALDAERLLAHSIGGGVPSTHSPASPPAAERTSFFQTGASALIRSIASRAPAKASSR